MHRSAWTACARLSRNHLPGCVLRPIAGIDRARHQDSLCHEASGLYASVHPPLESERLWFGGSTPLSAYYCLGTLIIWLAYTTGDHVPPKSELQALYVQNRCAFADSGLAVGGTVARHSGPSPDQAGRGGPMSTLDALEPAADVIPNRRTAPSFRIVRALAHLLVWSLLLVPAIRSMARGWRPLGDDAAIAIGAWRTFTLHPPLVGQLTFATSTQGNSNPGPLEYWILGPFVHLDPGQGALLGSAILCAVILSVTIETLWRTAGMWAAVVFAVAIADMAITTPTPFLDPVWNSSFGFFWFAAFLGIAFAVGLGNLRYFPLLLFVGSVTIDSHLLYLPSMGCVLLGALICGWFARRPINRRWLWWTVIVAVLCWAGPLYQQFFEARPNISALLRSEGILSGGTVQRTEGFVFGLRALGRVGSLNPIWASPRPILPFASSNDIAHRNILLGLVMVAILVAVTVMARRHGHRALLSMCILSIAALLGTVILFASTPVSYYEAFIWINLELWLVGLCVWITLGLAAFVAIRPQIAIIRPQIAAIRPRTASPHSARRRPRFRSRANERVRSLPWGRQALPECWWSCFPTETSSS